MDNFCSASYVLVRENGFFQVGGLADLKKEHERMEEAGLVVDYENNVYVREGYGAYIKNVDQSIKSFEDLKKRSGVYGYLCSKYINDLERAGFECVIGPGAPSTDGKVYGNGLYCRNYKELLNERKNKQKIK